MSIMEFLQIVEYFGIFATSTIFVPFYAACFIAFCVMCVGRIIRGSEKI